MADFDLIVIGAGSGGVRASRMAAKTGAKVAIIEADEVGGTCVLRGCIPKKLLVYASRFAEDFEDAHAFGWDEAELTFDWRRLITDKDKEIARLNRVYLNLLREAGVQLVEGRARLSGAHSVDVNGKTLTAETILIATGSRPQVPEKCAGRELAITSNEAFHLDTLPKRIVIAGAGYIAVEFAGIFQLQSISRSSSMYLPERSPWPRKNDNVTLLFRSTIVRTVVTPASFKRREISMNIRFAIPNPRIFGETASAKTQPQGAEPNSQVRTSPAMNPTISPPASVTRKIRSFFSPLP